MDAFEAHVQDLRHAGDHERLGQPRHADEQAVAAGKNGRKDLFDHVGLADDDAAKLLDHLRARLAELSQVFADPIRGHGGLPQT